MRNRFITLFLVVFSFGGCTLGPDFQLPGMDAPQQYRTSLDAEVQIADLPWWEYYEDPQIQSLIKTALENNQDLKRTLARIEESAALLGIARADYFPQIDLRGSTGRNEFEDTARVLEERESTAVAAQGFWELDLFGKFRRANEAARAEMLAQEYFYRATTLALVARVASTYFEILDFENRLKISQETLASRKEATRIISERFNRGYVAQIDLFQAQIQEEEAASAVQAAQRAVRQRQNALFVLLGGARPPLDGSVSLLTRPSLMPVASGIPSELLERRPDIQAAAQELRAQNARIGVAEALRFPSLALTGTFGLESLELVEFNGEQDRFWNFSADLLSPLLSANRNINRVRVEEYRTEQLAQSYYETVLQAFREVEDALIAIHTLKEEYAARTRQVKAGRGATRLSRARYNGGETTYLEVLEVERSLFESQLAQSNTRKDLYLAHIDLYRALGGGWELQE
ncbi:efflux transporter outer membrane subunit [bacterium]|nr:efflux transporter outer membrane subunit [bacterium]